jgi:hypothetical protein
VFLAAATGLNIPTVRRSSAADFAKPVAVSGQGHNWLLLQGDPDTYFQHFRAAMLSQGWSEGAPPGQHYHGTTLHKGGVTANIGYMPSDHSRGQIILYGECRDTNDHHHDPRAGLEITNQLTAR